MINIRRIESSRRTDIARVTVHLVMLCGLLFASINVNAQDEPSIVGKWEQLEEMVHIEIRLEDGVADGVLSAPRQYYAEITRADWNPGRVGRKVYQNMVYSGKNRWTAEETDDKGKARKVRLSMRKDGYLHTTSFLDGRKKIRWTRLPDE